MLSALRPLHILAFVAIVAIAVPLAFGFFGAVHPALDSFAHFRAHLAVLLGLVALPLFATRFLKFGALVVLAAILAFATTSGTVPIPGLGMRYGAFHPVDPDRPVYRLVQLNLRYDNPEPGLVLSMIGRVQPDVITLNEVSSYWAGRLEPIKAMYPYSLFCPYPAKLWGVAILSRRPFAQGSTPFCDDYGVLAVATVDFGGRSAVIAALHLGWPWPFEQYWEIGGLWPFFGRLGPTAILAGDLNATPWSRSPARIAEAGGLTLLPSPGPTWLSRRLPKFLFFAGLPIDNSFAKGDIEVHTVTTLDPVGSDHLPLLLTFSFKQKTGDPETDLAAIAAR